MLKITEREGFLLLEGRIAERWVPELERAAANCLRKNPSLELDLSGVRYVDAAGAELLGRLAARSVALRGHSGYLAELLARRRA
jgi:ABC-type transporter Mla MlaB component